MLQEHIYTLVSVSQWQAWLVACDGPRPVWPAGACTAVSARHRRRRSTLHGARMASSKFSIKNHTGFFFSPCWSPTRRTHNGDQPDPDGEEEFGLASGKAGKGDPETERRAGLDWLVDFGFSVKGQSTQSHRRWLVNCSTEWRILNTDERAQEIEQYAHLRKNAQVLTVRCAYVKNVNRLSDHVSRDSD